MPELIFNDEAYAIAGAAMDVYYTLGRGFLEPVYQEALAVEFGRRLVPFEREKRLELFYKGTKLQKTYSPDFVCYGQIVVELKVIPRITNIEISQLINYLKVMRLRLDIIANFGSDRTLEWKRVVI